MKIIIALLVPILLGIVVGSNLVPVMTVVILNQPTIALPLGVWLAIAVGLGLLSSIIIQVAIFVDRRWLTRHIRQLQTRLQQSDEAIFTYTSQGSAANSSSTEKPSSSKPKISLFSSYRSKFGGGVASEQKLEKPTGDGSKSTTGVSENRFANQQPVKSNPNDRDDWDAAPISNRQLDWEDANLPKQQNLQYPNNNSTIDRQEIPDQKFYSEPRTQKIQREPELTSREVYDADFRLIQPPYKEPVEIEDDDDRESSDFEYTEIDQEEDFDRSSSSVKPSSPYRSTPANIADDEDWGFDFEDTSVRRN